MTIRKKRRERRHRTGHYGEGHLRQLRSGHDHFGDAWGGWPERNFYDPPEAVREDMAVAWELHGESVLREWDRPGARPYGWWLFSSSKPRDVSIPEALQLFRTGLIESNELAAVAADAKQYDERMHANPYGGGNMPFRREWHFWQFVAPCRRNLDETESNQLIEMAVLTTIEADILENPQGAMAVRFGQQTGFDYLSENECETLGLSEFNKTTPAVVAGTSD